jgi:hypothetical protein
MKITEVTVSTGRVIPHPRESYANLRPSISLKATVEAGDSVEVVANGLYTHAELLLAAHIRLIQDRIEAEYQAKCKREDEEYERRQRERSLAAVTDADALDDDDVDDLEDEEDDE